MKKYLLASLIAIAAASSPNARAVLLAYENFDITAGTDNIAGTSGTGSSGWSGNWTLIGTDNSGDIISPGYTYPSLSTAGNRGSVAGDATATYYYRNMATPFIVSSGSATIWGSMLIDATASATGGQFAMAGVLNSLNPTATTRGMTIGAAGGNSNYRVTTRDLSGSSGDILATTSTSAGNLSFIVFSMTLNPNSGANDAISVWINPNLSLFDGTAGSLTGSVLSNSSFDYIGGGTVASFGFGTNYTSGDGLAGIDEVRLGTTLGDVVVIPEPGSSLLLGLGLAAVTLFRRRGIANS